jgi:hypothetical protein
MCWCPALRVQIEIQLFGVQLAEEAQQIDQAAPQPVHRPRRDHVHHTPRDGAQQRLHRWPALAREAAADALVIEHCRHGPTVLLSRGTQFAGPHSSSGERRTL